MVSNIRRGLLMFAGALALGLAPLSAGAQTVLNVGAYPSNVPYEFKNADGKFEGFEVDLANEIASRLGMTASFGDFNFQALFAATTSKRIDIAISSITITSERLKSQSFTQPYYDTTTDFAARRDSPLASFSDLKGKSIGVIAGTVGEKWVNENKAEYGFSDVKSYNSNQDMRLDLIAGRIDAAVNDSMKFGLAKVPELEVKDSIPSGNRLGMMMTKDHPLLGQVNDAISAIKDDGTMATLYRKWFGEDPAPGSSTLTPQAYPTE